MGVIRHLYDLAGRDESFRFSPYCWRSRLALAHKGLDYETASWRLHDKAALEFSGQGRVPVLRDGASSNHDSWAIAVHLEENYPDHPSLFGAPAAVPVVRALNCWADFTLNAAISRLVVKRVYDLLDPRDQPYFRQTREERFAASLEVMASRHEESFAGVQQALVPARRLLESQAWMAGDAPAYADHIVAGSLLWATLLEPRSLFEAGERLEAWFNAMLDRYDGIGRTALRQARAN
jgi:glutathione S-transferase